MGIAGFYLWLQRWYDSCVENIPDDLVEAVLKGNVTPDRESGLPRYDNLYLDMNGLIHPCCHDTAPLPEPKSEEEMFERIFAQVDLLYKIVLPRKCFVLCIDGVAPQSKMNQQRSRRFRAAEERVESDTISAMCAKSVVEHGLPPPFTQDRWDHNVITPSTPFMERLGLALEWFIVKKLNEDRAWRHVVVVFSDAHVPGEGEHKIMHFIRALRMQPGYNGRTSHVIHGMDADLVCLGLSTHEENVVILRNQLTETFQPDHSHFCYFNLNRYRLRLKNDFGGIDNMDFEKVLDDFIFLCFFVGNDFLPHVPLISIKTKGIELLLDHYVRNFSTHLYLTNGGEVNFSNLSKFLQPFVRDYMDILKQEYTKSMSTKQRAKDNVETRVKQTEAELKRLLSSVKEGFSNKQEISDAAYKAMMFIIKERARLVVDKEPLGFSYADDDFRDIYYAKKFGWDTTDRKKLEKNIKNCCSEYLRGTQWVMRYYTKGCPSWDWFYPFHYAPLLTDLAQFKGIVNVEMSLGTPRHPVVQLLSVLPRLSVHALPKELHEAVKDPDSVLGPFYPEKTIVDFSEASFSYQGVLRLPFINNNQLQAACEELVELEPDHGSTLLFCHKSNLLSKTLEPLLGNCKKNEKGEEMLPVPETLAFKLPIAGRVGRYEMAWPLKARLKCPDRGIAKSGTQYGTCIEGNAVCCYSYELDTNTEYMPVLLRNKKSQTKDIVVDDESHVVKKGARSKDTSAAVVAPKTLLSKAKRGREKLKQNEEEEAEVVVSHARKKSSKENKRKEIVVSSDTLKKVKRTRLEQ